MNSTAVIANRFKTGSPRRSNPLQRVCWYQTPNSFGAVAAPCLLLLLALALRAAPLTAYRFHQDEALYASWALLTAEDPALISVPVDKPPLFIYLLAGLFRLLGSSEAVARLPNLFASVVSVALLYTVGRRAYDRPTALMAAALYAASPFAILFAPTAFTDPLLVLWMLLGLWAALAQRPLLAGLALGLAYATKQQSVLLIPLVVAMEVWEVRKADREWQGAGCRSQGDEGRSAVGNHGVQLLVGFLPVFALVTWWDSLRWHVQPSFWDRSITTYGGLELLPPAAWGERLADWAQLLGYIFASPLLNATLLIGLPILLWTAMRLHATRNTQHATRTTHHASRTTHYDLLLTAYVVAYLLLHLTASFQVWDRYLLPLVPLLCLLLARIIRGIANCELRIANLPFSRLVIIVMACALLPPAYMGVTGRLPVGGDHGAYDGIDRLAAYVRAHLPPDAILYYHWLGWHYDYYLRDASQERVWYPDPQSLVELVMEHGDRAQGIAFPGWKDDGPVRQALAARGLALVPRFATYRHDGSRSFALYLIETTDYTDYTDYTEAISVKSVVETYGAGGVP